MTCSYAQMLHINKRPNLERHFPHTFSRTVMFFLLQNKLIPEDNIYDQ